MLLDRIHQTKTKELELAGDLGLNVSTKPSVQVRIAQVSLPKFSGKFQDWVTIKEMFLSLVGDSITIPKIQKFYCVLSPINGDAKCYRAHTCK